MTKQWILLIATLIACTATVATAASSGNLNGPEVRKALSGKTVYLSASGIVLPIAYRGNGTMSGRLKLSTASLAGSAPLRIRTAGGFPGTSCVSDGTVSRAENPITTSFRATARALSGYAMTGVAEPRASVLEDKYGWTEKEIRRFLGENLLRVYKANWK